MIVVIKTEKGIDYFVCLCNTISEANLYIVQHYDYQKYKIRTWGD
jgi:hypothetical protein